MVYVPDSMRNGEFDSSDEEDSAEEQQTPLQISWLSLSVVDCPQFIGICALPGCKYKDVRRNLQKDIGELQGQGVEEVFVFCTRGELHKYRVPHLLEAYCQQGLIVHHLPFPDGGAPELEHCCQILDLLQSSLRSNRRTVIHCYGGLGRSGLMAACLLLQLSDSMIPDKAIDILRELRGSGAIQTVKQYNFLHEFRERLAAHQANKEASSDRSVSR
ncbi:cyclin-dependent kinase inhibitor 3 isoform X2 [Amia ocellicauda]|uniref:cyclin-dependent kinase inhibitor 3 isoform X2 n=1 Tax=Amia ocellicauda TaxID=2972642 RepID=UPI003463C468